MRLINGECLEEMDKLIEQGVKVDAIITDPPYGNMDTDGGRKLGINNWDKAIIPEAIFERANKLLRKNGKLIIFSQEPYTSKLITESISNIPFSYRATWVKDNFANALGVKKAMVSITEDILIFSKNHQKHDFEGFHPLRPYFKKVMDFIGLNLKQINNKLGHRRAEHTFYIDSTQYGLCTEKTYLELIQVFGIDKIETFKEFSELKEINKNYRDNLVNKMNSEFPSVFNLWEGKKYKSNILEYKKDYSGFHPTQKPILLMEDLIKTYTNEGETVLDFTMGSGSTIIACQNTNRKGIGIERDQNYFNIAKKRICEEY